jgi:hypothetical protein
MKRAWGTWIGLVVAASGCTDRGGFSLEDETGDDPTGSDPTGTDPDPTGTDPDPTGGNDIPLELVLAKFNATGQFLLLRFSEPMAPVDAVDPSDFRVSFARTVNYSGYYGEYSWSFYVDPGVYYDYNYYQYTPLVVTKVSAGSKETDIVLRFETPVDPQVCDWLAQLEDIYENDPSQEGKVAIFPHYSPGAVPVESVDGEVLSAIGPDWVEYESSFLNVEGFGWPNLDPQVAIPCEL